MGSPEPTGPNWGRGVTYEDQEQLIGCGCEDHGAIPTAPSIKTPAAIPSVPAAATPSASPAATPGAIPDATAAATSGAIRGAILSAVPSAVPGAMPGAASGNGSRRRFLRTAAGLAIAAPTLLAAACSSSSSSPKQNTAAGTTPTTGAPSTGGTPSQPPTSPSSATTGTGALPGPETADAALLASRYDGLKPFAPAPPPPATKPVNTNVDLPPVISHVPTDQKICFLTIDDGAEKDPAFLQMVKDFRIPITMFLADCFIQDDYAYFTQLRDTGYCTIQNHTLHHPDMVTLNAQRQLAEVTGQQQKLVKNYNTHPYLFRAPFGNSNKATQEACKQNGLKAICYWRASFQKQGFQWQAADKKLRPGDILLAHFRGPKANGKGWPEMHELMTNLFRIVQDQGYTFARLEDYV
ncbi:peptidoglycan/xylan/chitin deacetylase (PgdA/CDA1 family) [Catenulispora sp. EB89]